jgi:uncharacterized protein (TIGR02597 family)
LPLRLAKEFSGNATSVSRFKITAAGTTFPTRFKDLDAMGDPLYYIEILDGTHIGLRLDIKDVSGDTITLFEDVKGILNNNVSFSVSKYWTLAEIFGNEGELVGINPTANLSNLDYVVCGDGKGALNYFYLYQAPSFLGGGKNWAVVGGMGSADVSNSRILENTIYIMRVGTARPELSIINTGILKRETTRVPIFPGINLVALSFPINKKLNTSGLQEAGLLAGYSLRNADILITTHNGKLQLYYLNQSPAFLGGGISWAKIGEPANVDKGEDIITGPVIIIRKDNSPFDWVQTPPFNI